MNYYNIRIITNIVLLVLALLWYLQKKEIEPLMTLISLFVGLIGQIYYGEVIAKVKNKDNNLNNENKFKNISLNNTNNNSLNVQIHSESITKDSLNESNKINTELNSLEKRKLLIKILFIDDERFDIVSILKAAGWKNIKCIKDVDSLDTTDIIKSDIIFIDINGVGKKLFFSNEGLGLAEALKNKYGNTKKIITYSANPIGDRFSSALNVVDYRLRKDSEPIHFLQLLEDYSNELLNNG